MINRWKDCLTNHWQMEGLFDEALTDGRTVWWIINRWKDCDWQMEKTEANDWQMKRLRNHWQMERLFEAWLTDGRNDWQMEGPFDKWLTDGRTVWQMIDRWEDLMTSDWQIKGLDDDYWQLEGLCDRQMEGLCDWRMKGLHDQWLTDNRTCNEWLTEGRTVIERWEDCVTIEWHMEGLFDAWLTNGITVTNDWQMEGLLIDYFKILYVPLKNFSLIWRRHHCRWRAAKFCHCSALGAFEQEGSLSCHTCCDTGPRFSRSHPKDRQNSVASYDTRGDVEDLF
jgi:hypothetical protein